MSRLLWFSLGFATCGSLVIGGLWCFFASIIHDLKRFTFDYVEEW